MVDDIITGLARINWLFVIARNSTFTYKGRAVDVKQVGRELGVRYVLEGSVRKAGDSVRVTAQMIDASTGAHVWAERYDRSSDDIFALQDEIARSALGAIRRDGFRSTTTARCIPVRVVVNATELATFGCGTSLASSTATCSGETPISDAAISTWASRSSEMSLAAAIASAIVGGSCRTRRGPYLVFQAGVVLRLIEADSTSCLDPQYGVYSALQQENCAMQ